MIQIPNISAAWFFLAVVAFAALCIWLGWLCHGFYIAEDQPQPQQVVIPPWCERTDPMPRRAPYTRPAHAADRRPLRLRAFGRQDDPSHFTPTGAWPELRDDVDVDSGVEPKPLPGFEVGPLRSRFIKTAAEMRAEVDALEAKRQERAARRANAQLIVSVPVFEGVKA